MIEIVIATVMAFIGTNIDDIFINTLFFAQAETKKQVRSVVVGQYAGIGILVLISMLGGYGLQLVPEKYIALLGVIPIVLGIKEWIAASKEDENREEQDLSKGLTLKVMLVTITNGADNIGVYIPLFASYTMAQMLVVMFVFVVMIALWCVLGKKLADLPVLRRFLLKYKKIIVPVVFILLGVYIILKGMLGV